MQPDTWTIELHQKKLLALQLPGQARAGRSPAEHLARHMGFSEAVAWWDEWQVRVLALASLFLQCFLYIAAPLRGRGIVPPSVRFLIWLAYMGSDAAAIYALAALFNHQRKLEWVSAHRSSASLQALWAPILLLHLGGQDSIAAYNLEDNELWKRHVLTALSQVISARRPCLT